MVRSRCFVTSGSAREPVVDFVRRLTPSASNATNCSGSMYVRTVRGVWPVRARMCCVELVLRVIADLGRHFLDLPSWVPQQRVHPQQSRRRHQESGRMDPRHLELPVQRAQDRAGRRREVLCVLKRAGERNSCSIARTIVTGSFASSGASSRSIRSLSACAGTRSSSSRNRRRSSSNRLSTTCSMPMRPSSRIGSHRDARERRVDHDRQGRKLPVDLPNHVGAGHCRPTTGSTTRTSATRCRTAARSSSQPPTGMSVCCEPRTIVRCCWS